MTDRIFVLRRRQASIHRIWQNKYLREFTKDINPTSVINLGAQPDASDKQGSLYSDYFPGSTFKTLDTRPHDHSDYVQGDLMDHDQNHGPYDLVIAMSIIEHIDKPWLAAPVISNLVAPGGHLFIAMPWFYPTHQGDDFGDHWRARPSGIALLFDNLRMIRSEYFPSAIKVVRDRKNYWRDPNATATGCAVLLKKNV